MGAAAGRAGFRDAQLKPEALARRARPAAAPTCWAPPPWASHPLVTPEAGDTNTVMAGLNNRAAHEGKGGFLQSPDTPSSGATGVHKTTLEPLSENDRCMK